MSIKEREEFLFQKLREKDASIVVDGVICEQEFLNARYKIVYILKEVNGGKSWDLRDFVYEGGRPQTWDNIARWTEGILSWEKEFPWSEMETDNEQRRFYDVNEKRVQKVFKICKKYLSHFQKSVFRGEMTPSKFIQLRKDLNQVIDKDEDFICIIKLMNDNVFGEEVLGNGGEVTGESLMI